MKSDFEDVMAKRTDEELIKIVNNSEDYQPEAIKAAEQEIEKRQLIVDKQLKYSDEQISEEKVINNMGKCIFCGRKTNNKYSYYQADNLKSVYLGTNTTREYYANIEYCSDYLCNWCISRYFFVWSIIGTVIFAFFTFVFFIGGGDGKYAAIFTLLCCIGCVIAMYRIYQSIIEDKRSKDGETKMFEKLYERQRWQIDKLIRSGKSVEEAYKNKKSYLSEYEYKRLTPDFSSRV